MERNENDFRHCRCFVLLWIMPLSVFMFLIPLNDSRYDRISSMPFMLCCVCGLSLLLRIMLFWVMNINAESWSINMCSVQCLKHKPTNNITLRDCRECSTAKHFSSLFHNESTWVCTFCTWFSHVWIELNLKLML